MGSYLKYVKKSYRSIAKKEIKKKKKQLVLSPSLYCSPSDRPITQETSCLGEGTWTLFRQPADREEGELVFQGTMLLKLEFRLLCIKKKKKKRNRCGLLLQISWCCNLLLLHLSRQVRSQCSFKPPMIQLLFSVLKTFISI